MRNPEHVPELDGLRALAALAVLVFHAPGVFAGVGWVTVASRWRGEAMEAWVAAWVAVTVAVAAIVHRVVEMPFQRLRRHLP